MQSSEVLHKLFNYIDEHKEKFIENLREIVAIPSFSNTNDRIKQYEIVYWIAECMRQVGIKATLKEIGSEFLPNGEEVPLPPVIYGTLGSNPKKKTVCVYGHLDILQTKDYDWNCTAFLMKEKDGRLFGTGTSNNKGPVMCWINVVEAFLDINEEVPVNIKFIIEAMGKVNSIGLFDLLPNETEFLNDVDYVCVTETTWLGNNKPCIAYNLRGVCYFSVEIQCAFVNLHSGNHGGSLHEAMADLMYLLNTLTDKEGRILITDFYNNVANVSSEEEKMFKNIEFDVDAYRRHVGTAKLPYDEDKVQLLMHRWRHPVLSIHGVEGAFSEHGAKTIIPSKVIGKFSIRLVPNLTCDSVEQLVTTFLNMKWKERGSPNTMMVRRGTGGPPFSSDRNHPNVLAASKAINTVFKENPDYICHGAALPVAVAIQELTNKSVVILPIGNGDYGPQDENISIRNYIEGTKVLAAYLYEISLLKT